MYIDAAETLTHTPTPYLSKQMNIPRSSLSPIQYQLSSPHGETMMFDLFPPPLRFSDISNIEGLLNYVLGSELTTKKPRNENVHAKYASYRCHHSRVKIHPRRMTSKRESLPCGAWQQLARQQLLPPVQQLHEALVMVVRCPGSWYRRAASGW